MTTAASGGPAADMRTIETLRGRLGVSLLVVDDEPDVRATLVAMLGRAGYSATGVEGAHAALEQLRRRPEIALVLSDLNMPGGDGMALLREMQRSYPDTATVMLTGDGDLTRAVECLRLGAKDYLTKPLLMHEVLARIAMTLEQRRLTLENRRLREQYQTDLEQQVRTLSRKNQDMFLAQVQMAVTMLEAKDPYTRGHSGRVADYAVATGRVLGIAPDLLEEIRLGGELHDIGKIGTRDAVLRKPSRLTASEIAHVRAHTTAGAEMLSVLKADHPEVVSIARWHHERMDGGGFPDGLVGTQIPLSARVVCVVDSFDAMTSDRPYTRGRDGEEARAELRRCAGLQFDPEVVEAFLSLDLERLIHPREGRTG